MALRFSDDVRPAAWLTQSRTPADRLIMLGPDGFESYARLRYVPDPTEPGQRESDLRLPAQHPTEIAQLRRAVHVLAAFTTTPDDGYFCLWEGYGGMPLPPAVADGPLVVLPDRRYALLRGRLEDIDDWGAGFGDTTTTVPPAFVWPADQSWCLTSDVDPHWAGIAASQTAVDALLADPALDVAAARLTDALPTYF